MMPFKTTLLAFILFGATPLYAVLPDPSAYPVPSEAMFKGEPASVDFSSYEGAAKFKTKLIEGAKRGPNYAGHYTVVSIGCGTQCQESWVLEAQTGKIVDKIPSVIGVKFQLNSTLMVVNPPDEQLKKAYEAHPEQPLLGTMETTYQILKDNKFDVVLKEKWAEALP